MTKISRLIQLLPCARLQDFPTHLNGHLAAGVLANWTAAWHPSLISATGSAPIVFGTDKTSVEDEHEQDPDLDSFENEPDEPPPSFDAEFWRDSLVFVPEISLESIVQGFAAKAVGENARLITGMTDRNEIIQRAFHLVDAPAAPEQTSNGLEGRVQDFYALAYAYLQIQLLTRKIRFSSNLDQVAFDKRLVAAAKAFSDSDDSLCDAEINACYDLLLEEKNNYYPVKPTLIDLVLTTPKTVGARFEKETDGKHVVNFLMAGETLATISDTAKNKLKSKLDVGQAAIVGGNEMELPDTLLSPETTLRQLKRGRGIYRTELDYNVSIFMRRRFGLMSSLPNMLDQLNFNGAMHTSLDGGEFPTGSYGTMRWSGDADASILAKAETLLDASEPATFLDLGVTIGRQIDSAHEATCTFAHWPGRTSAALGDLIRVAARSPVLGEFITLDDHFETLYDPGYAEKFSTEEYASPFLDEAIRSSSEAPLSKFVDYWSQYASLHLIECFVVQLFVALLITKKSDVRAIVEPWLEECDSLRQKIESPTVHWEHDADAVAVIEKELADVINRLLVEYSQCLAEVESGTGGEFSIVNPLFFTRRITVSQAVKNASASFYRSKQPYLVQQTIEDQLHAVAEVKGSSVTPIRTASSSMPLKKEPPVLEGQKLQNEFFVATIDSKTGALQCILYHGQRGNLASQRLVLVDKGSSAVSTMVCDEIEPVAVNHLSGEIKTSGRIVVGDETVADFTQVFRLRRGQQVLELEIDIRPTIGLENSKRKYFAHRLAWRDEASKVFGSDQFVRSELYAPKFESPNFVDIENLDYGLTLLPGGLPYHQRIERRQLETLLIVGKESRRAFKVGIGVDLKYPLKSAFDLASPALIAKSGSAAAQQFFHLDSRNVLVTYARPIFDSADGAWGMEMRLQETQRRGGEVSLFTPLKMSQVYRTNFDGDVIETLHDAEAAAVTQIRLPHAAADYFQIRIVFALG